MSTVFGILSGVLLGALVLSAVVWQAVTTIREERHARPRPLVRPDIETVLRDHGFYVVHSESHFDLQLTLF